MARGPVQAPGSRVVTATNGARGARALLERATGLADEPTDDDDLRLRKRVLVIASYILVLGALQLPALAQGLPLSWFVAATVPPVSAINLVVLARTRRFERYVRGDPWTVTCRANVRASTRWHPRRRG